MDMTQSGISGLLNKDNTLLVTEPVSKEDLISKLAALACKGLPETEGKEILQKVLAREAGISTTLDTGLSIPHARVDEITDFKAAMAVLPREIQDPAGDIGIKVMFLFLSPANPKFFQKHLQVLAELSETFKESFMAKITAAAGVEEILAIINNK